MIDSTSSDPWEAKARPLLPALEEKMNAESVLTPLYSGKLITKPEWDEIKSLRSNKEKIDRLIVDILPQKEPGSFDKFVAILQETEGQEYLADLMKRGEAEHRLEQLSFDKNDWVVLLEDISDDSVWCKGFANGKTGLFLRSSLFGMPPTKLGRPSSLSSFHSTISADSCIDDVVESGIASSKSSLSSSRTFLCPSRSSCELRLQFCAFIHPGWEFNRNKHVVSISFVKNYFASDDSSSSEAQVALKVKEIVETRYGRVFMISSDIVTVPNLLEASPIEYRYVVTDVSREGKSERIDEVFEPAVKDVKNASYNRVLSVRSDYTGEGVLVKRDGIIEAPKRKNHWNWGYNFFSSYSAIGLKCLETMVPKLFRLVPSYDGEHSDMLASEAVSILYDILESLTCVHIKEASSGKILIVKKDFDVEKHLCTVIKQSICGLQKADVSEAATGHLAASAAAVAVVVEKYHLAEKLNVHDLELLVSALNLHFDWQGRTCRSLERIIEHFPDQRSFPLAAARHICAELCKRGSSQWIFVMPLIHFLSGKIRPFDELRFCKWESSEWWCLDELNSDAISMASPLLDMKDRLLSLARLDSLLRRNVLFTLCINDLSQWKNCASNIEFVTTVVKKVRVENHLIDCLEVPFLEENLEQLYATLASFDKNDLDSHEVFEMAAVVAELLQHLSRSVSLSTSLGNLFLLSVRLFFAYINVFGQVNDGSTGELKGTLTEKVCMATRDWVSNFEFAEESLHSTLSLCNSFLKIDVSDTGLNQLWQSLLCAEIDNHLEEKGEGVIIVFFQVQRLHAKLVASVRKFAAKVLEQVLAKENSLQVVLDKISAKWPWHSHDVLSNQLLKLLLSETAPEEQHSNEIWLRSIVTWRLWKSYFFNCDLGNCDEEVHIYILKARKVVEEVVQLLDEDTLSVAHFNTSSKRDTFLEVCHLLDTQKPNVALCLREKAEEAMRKAFKAEKRLLNNFLRICEKLGNVSLDEILGKVRNAAAEPEIFSEFEHLQTYIEQLSDLHVSTVFQNVWHDYTSEPMPPLDSLEKLLQFVLQPVFKFWKRLYFGIEHGTVTAFEVQKYFGEVLFSKEQLQQELKIILKVDDSESSLGGLFNERMERIFLCGRKCFICNVSKLITKTCEALGAEAVSFCPHFAFDQQQPLPLLKDYSTPLKEFLVSLKLERIVLLYQLSSDSKSFLKKIKNLDGNGQFVLQNLCHVWSIVSKYQELVVNNI